MQIEHLYRYPVKGLTAEALDEVVVEPGRVIPWDRAFALAQGDAGFDPAAPAWLRKKNFLCLMVNAPAALLKASFNPRDGMLFIRAPDGRSVEANALHPAGRVDIAAFLAGILPGEMRGTPSFHHVPGHVFSDDKRPVVSLINEASLAELERKVGAPRHRLRFRANIYFSGAPAWSEFDWIGREIQVGSARLRVIARIDRCPATAVNPETAEIDANPVRELRDAYGHVDLGVFAEVIDGGRIAPGEAIALLRG